MHPLLPGVHASPATRVYMTGCTWPGVYTAGWGLWAGLGGYSWLFRVISGLFLSSKHGKSPMLPAHLSTFCSKRSKPLPLFPHILQRSDGRKRETTLRRELYHRGLPWVCSLCYPIFTLSHPEDLRVLRAEYIPNVTLLRDLCAESLPAHGFLPC